MRKHHHVHEGQIAGFRGEVTAVHEWVVNVAVQIFGRVTPVDLAFGQIELVSENSNRGGGHSN